MSDAMKDSAATLRRMAAMADAGEVTGVVAIVIVNGNRFYYRGFVDGFALADLTLGTMDLVDEMRSIARGEPLPMPPLLSPVGDDCSGCMGTGDPHTCSAGDDDDA